LDFTSSLVAAYFVGQEAATNEGFAGKSDPIPNNCETAYWITA
jgi:hypothetical protein